MYSTEQEWIHMFSVVGDLGSAMELGARREALERELETMATREAEIAERLTEIRSLRNEVNAGRQRFERSGEDLAQALRDRQELQEELEATKAATEDRGAEIAKLRSLAMDLKTEIMAMMAAVSAAAEESRQLKELVDRLEPQVVNARAAVGPRQKELTELRAMIAKFEEEERTLQEQAQKDSVDLTKMNFRIDALKDSLGEATAYRNTLQVEVKERQRALIDLPKELATMNATVQALKAEEAELDAALGPRSTELASLRQARDVAQAAVGKLREEHLKLANEQQEVTAERDGLEQKRVDLESEISRLNAEFDRATKDRDQLVQLVPKLLLRRNSIFREVAGAVEEAKLMREELLMQAQQMQKRLQTISLEASLENEERDLQNTAAQVGLAASGASDGLRRAQEALVVARRQRKQAQEDFERLQGAMAQRLEALRAEEEVLATCSEQHQGLEDAVKTLMSNTTEQVERFRKVRKKMTNFQKQVQRISGVNENGRSADVAQGHASEAAGSGAASGEHEEDTPLTGAFGLLGSLLKAGAEGLRQSAESARVARDREAPSP